MRDVASAQQESILLGQGRSLIAKCVRCDYHSACGGGCIATRWRSTQARGNDDTYCEHRKRLVDGIAALLAQPGAPSGVWCRRVHSRPRKPNSMADVASFLARWDDPLAARSAVRLHTSVYGNINTLGLPGVHEADDLDPHHPQWHQAIEPGVWPLVDVCTSGWGLVTYDSCQGHAYTDLELAPAVRRVGILPRSPGEYAATAAALCRAATQALDDLPGPVRIIIGRAELTCETTGRRMPVLDIVFDRVSNYEWGTYFAALERATAVIAASLRRYPPGGEQACACHVFRHTTQRQSTEVREA